MDNKIKTLLDLIEKYRGIKSMYLDYYHTLSVVRDELKAAKYEINDMVNFIYVIREISKFADDLRKEADGIGQMLVNAACAIYITRSNTEPVRASLATGTPNLKLAASIPNANRDPEAFKVFMEYLGVDESAISKNVVKPHWPGISELVSTLAEEGQPLPPGIDPDKTYPTYTMRITKVKDLDEVLESLDQAEADWSLVKRKEVTAACNELLTKR